MDPLFLNPFAMAAGGALVSSPILIHLINRMRFKRIRWAAMEFLLKSQKKNRRRLIIEQLILLLLRILLVLLTGFLLARFVGAAFGQVGQSATHVILIDDTPSMGDRWAEGGQQLTSFVRGREEIAKVCKKAAQANAAQNAKVYVLSDLKEPIWEGRLGDEAIREIDRKLQEMKVSALHVDPATALEKAGDLFTDASGSKVIHLVSDFREVDWRGYGSKEDRLRETTDKLLQAGVNLSFIDVAHPHRAETRGASINHDNLAIVDVRAETRVVAEGIPVEFNVVIKNFSNTEKQSFLRVRRNGRPEPGAEGPIESLSPGDPVTKKFTLVFEAKKDAPEIKPEMKPEEREEKRRLDRKFERITVEIDGAAGEGQAGLLADNIRDIVVEVRRRVPVLVIDGAGKEGQGLFGDSFHLEVGLAADRAYDVEFRSLDDVEKGLVKFDDLYPTVYLLNVPEIKNEAVRKRLEDYVANGGSLCYFLGDRAKPAFYNEMFTNHNKVFPLLLASRPTEPMTVEQKQEYRQKDEQPKLIFPMPNHTVVQGLYKSRPLLRYLLIDRYYPCLPRYEWDPDETRKEVEEIVVLPNRKWADDLRRDDYKRRAVEIYKQFDKAIGNKELTEYHRALQDYERSIKEALTADSQFKLVTTLDLLLNDPGNKEQNRPNMKELWAHPDMRDLGKQIEKFAKDVHYGDPLVVGRKVGKGRVVACMTSAGTKQTTSSGTLGEDGWNDWGSGSMATPTYPVFIIDLQRYLSEGESLSHFAGDPIQQQLDPEKYEPKVLKYFAAQDEVTGKAMDVALPVSESKPLTSFEKLDRQGTGPLNFAFTKSQMPGVYKFKFFPLNTPDQPKPETDEDWDKFPGEEHAYAFNINADAESDLKRAKEDSLKANPYGNDPKAGKVHLWSPGDNYDIYKNRVPDASESPWLYLFFLIVLIVEQAMAVHLSHHLKGSEAALPLPGGSRPATAA